MSDNTAPTTTEYQPKERMTDLLTRFDTAMMVSECGKTGQYHARPMVVARVDEGLNLWFFTEFCAPKIEEMKTNNKLCATFQDKDKWLSLAGKGRIENDNALKQELWSANSDKLKKWFPEDKKLDELTLLELETQWGEYWDSTGVMKPLQYGVEALKSVVTGTRMDANKAGNHAKLSLSDSTATTSLSAQ
ncbi:pyridoxamine 5'phosphate oxidase family superfamily protein [Acanthamoeba castellanii str. Neff]|uniref:Pyridoxamine 5'phosphate oxidase family superfamily protein n=1 Tax=Acanthamoeba castellanii (strain ATCC 30010 / Neff) TaxID=1257118 RepID=L8HFI3_ACACF|nr:pyridoxamine 5'phosphate oxidase family superfamily protein [Acanthamoeba castellanii str. Neff]ELR24284.1 pyridoxamine 5'phosphate oxidase family superfamily protein [Acanthamoeba castellanii str. Neff]